MAKKRSKATSNPQLAQDFKSVARRLECDEDAGRFEAALTVIVQARNGGDMKTKKPTKRSKKAMKAKKPKRKGGGLIALPRPPGKK